MKIFLFILLILFFLLIIYGIYKNTQTQAKGVIDGQLAVCSWKPNCISSTDTNDTKHYFAALKLDNNGFLKLKSVLNTFENIKIISKTDDYIHAVAKTKIGFKDDLEFYFNADSQTVSIRSLSRVGKSDFGVNKKRMIKIIKQLND